MSSLTKTYSVTATLTIEAYSAADAMENLERRLEANVKNEETGEWYREILLGEARIAGANGPIGIIPKG